MQHLQERRIIEELWDGVAFNADERDHLSLCTGCQSQYTMLAQMSEAFEIARSSEVRPEAEERLFSIFEKIEHDSAPEQAFQRLLGAMASWVQALPLWDSRQQGAAVGIRGAHSSSYRMLFGTDETEIELMIEGQNGLLRVMGEVMVANDKSVNGMALIELAPSAGAKSAIETESDVNGRFALEQVPPGVYFMTITPRYSQVVVIEALELT